MKKDKKGKEDTGCLYNGGIINPVGGQSVGKKALPKKRK
jgi:hypothetical protein